MGKKMSVNEKSADARTRKAEAKSAAAAASAKKKEEEYWSQHDNPKGRKDAKREEEERKRQEAAARKAEAKRLAAEEEAALANLGKKKAQPKTPKVTGHQLLLQKEAEQRRMAQQAEQLRAEQSRALTEEEYAKHVEIENINKEAIAVDARSVEAALAQLEVSDSPGSVDRHPEKRAKAAWEAYYARELERMKQDKPGLRLMAYRSLIFEKWQRSPENPRNQVKQ